MPRDIDLLIERKVSHLKDFQLKEEGEEAGSFSAVFSTFNVVDSDDDLTLPGAFGEQKVIISAYNHSSWNNTLPVGKGRIFERGEEAIVEGKFFLDTEGGMETYKTIKNIGDLQEFSYSLPEVDYEIRVENEQRIRVLKKIRVNEVSPVLMGAGVNTRLLDIKDAKPFKNEHACRLKDPGQYDRFARKNCEQKHDGKCIDVIYGIKEGKSEIQSLRYKIKVWNEADARVHCKTREGSFEAAEKAHGLKLIDHIESVLDDVKEVTERLQAVKDMREEKGKDISPDTVERMSDLEVALKEAVEKLEQIKQHDSELEAAMLVEQMRYEKLIADRRKLC